MAEMVRVPGVLGVSNGIDEALMATLVADGKLPADFQFRLLSLDREERLAIARQDILAILGYGEPSGNDYLHAELPACVFVATTAPVRPILAQLEPDYHMFHDLRTTARKVGIEEYIPRQSWAMYVHHFNPPLFRQLQTIYTGNPARMEAGNSRAFQYGAALARIVIKDSALLRIYNGEEVIHGHGPVRHNLLHYLLLDNHPELGPDPRPVTMA